MLVPCPGMSCTKLYIAEKSESGNVTRESALLRSWTEIRSAGRLGTAAGRDQKTPPQGMQACRARASDRMSHTAPVHSALQGHDRIDLLGGSCRAQGAQQGDHCDQERVQADDVRVDHPAEVSAVQEDIETGGAAHREA